MNDPIEMLRRMMLIRAFETSLAKRKDHGFQLLSTGEEAVAVGLSSALGDKDQLLTGGRSIGPAIARGVDPSRLMAELLGKSTGTNRGKGGRGHLSDPASGFFGSHAVVAGNITVATGVALAKKMDKGGNIVAILFGDGAAGSGTLHEALNIAALWKVPLLFVCNNNQLSVSVPRESALAPKKISDIGAAFGLPSQTIDGMDIDVVSSAMRDATQKIRDGSGPIFIETISYRFSSHSTTARETRDKARLEQIRSLDPIRLFAERLIKSGKLDAATQQSLEKEAQDRADAALKFADESSYPDRAEALTDVG